jgi:hypothetical protein
MFTILIRSQKFLDWGLILSQTLIKSKFIYL